MRPKILVIDDSKAVRQIAIRALAAYDCEVYEATNGFTALYAMERTSPTMLMLDVSMPTMDGIEMLTMLKSHPGLRDIPVIMLTSTTDHRMIPRITQLGVNAMIKKPFTEARLAETVLTVLKLKPVK